MRGSEVMKLYSRMEWSLGTVSREVFLANKENKTRLIEKLAEANPAIITSSTVKVQKDG